jgi:hypothetical protein
MASRAGAAEPTLEEMRAHLDAAFIGFVEGDPTVGELTAELPPSAAAGAPPVVIDLARWSEDALLAEAATTITAATYDCVLPATRPQPGVPLDRLGLVRGQPPALRGGRASRRPPPAGAAAGGAASAPPGY